jgi:hypothetical protein
MFFLFFNIFWSSKPWILIGIQPKMLVVIANLGNCEKEYFT